MKLKTYSSPSHLFQQGELHGPDLLLQVLQKKKTFEEAKAAWKQHGKEKEGKDGPEEGWLPNQKLPCRRCEDEGLDEPWKPIRSYNTSLDPAELWRFVVRRGQDLICFKCKKELKLLPSDKAIHCDACMNIEPRNDFDDASKRRWEKLDTGRIICLTCNGEIPKRADAGMFFCHGRCKTERPNYHFDKKQLAHWEADEDQLFA